MLIHDLIQEFYGWEEMWVCVWEEGDEEGKTLVLMMGLCTHAAIYERINQ